MTPTDSTDSAQPEERVLVSYLTLRRVVGGLGMLLPIIVAIWGFFLPPPNGLRGSISAYYATRTGDAFVGILFTIAWFLFAYRGYDKRDENAGNAAALFALLVALFPHDGAPPVSYIHFGAAAALFLVLSHFCIGLFTISKGTPTPQKLIRNRIYRRCGWIMRACIVLIGVYMLILKPTPIDSIQPVFWLESVALWAFGWSWFIKGETLWKDPA